MLYLVSSNRIDDCEHLFIANSLDQAKNEMWIRAKISPNLWKVDGEGLWIYRVHDTKNYYIEAIEYLST